MAKEIIATLTGPIQGAKNFYRCKEKSGVLKKEILALDSQRLVNDGTKRVKISLAKDESGNISETTGKIIEVLS